MEALCVQPVEEKGLMAKREELGGKIREQDEARMEASASTTDEETDEDSEPEPPLVVRRKVSFADAFGLNLVSVKEFDNAEVAESEVSRPSERDVAHPSEEFYISCLFAVPSSQEELDQKLEAQMVELESIELLPGTTTLRGIIRVVNLCYNKSVFARITLDRWNSYFDLLAEYVPGSSDRKTDRFTFRYTLFPPFERDGTRLEFCLRYETSTGTFWANNRELNYVLFCHQKGHIKEPPMQEDSYKSKRSCLKANRNGGAEEKTWETCSIATAAAEVEATHKAEKADRKTVNSVESVLYGDEHKPLVGSIKSRHKSTRLARVQDHLSQRKQQARKVSPHASANGQKASRSTLAPWGDSASFLYKCQKTQPNESPQVLTYHQIPLLTLDWNNDKPQQLGAADVDDIWTGTAKMTLSKASKENTPCGNDMWETFLNGAGNTNKKETSVCNVWQDFLNGPSCRDHSGVPESVWLQTAASVSPSNDKEPQAQRAASSQEFPEFQVGTDTPTTSAACQPLSDTLPANVALNAEDHQQPAEACVSSPRDDNTATHDASQRSQTNSVKDTSQEFSLEGAPPVSEHSVDSAAECRKHVVRERERAGIIGGADGSRGDEPFTSHTADLVTSSGESETTDMTAMPESPNASAGDRISQGAGLDEGLSSSGEGEVTGTAHNARDDMLAFRETIRQGTKDGARYVYSTSRQGAVEGITAKYRQNKGENTEEVIFRPQKTEECEISQRCGDEMQSGSQNSGNPLQEMDENEIKLAQSHADGFNAKQTNEENLEENKIMALQLKEDGEMLEDTEVETCTSKTPERITSMGIIHMLNEEALQPNSSQQMDNMSIILEGQDKQSRPIQAGEEVHEPEGKSLEQQELNPSREKKQVSQSDHDTSRHDPTDKCNPNPSKAVEQRWTHSQEDMRGQEEDVGGEISPEAATAKENAATEDTSTEYQPERTEEGVSQEDKDERVSIGELKIDAMRELMGNVESPRGERKNAPAGLEEQELSAEVESSPHVESKKLLGGTKDAITPELVGSLEAIEPGQSVERFGEHLVGRIWEEVFGKEAEVAYRDTNVVDGRRCRVTDATHLLFEKDSDDAFDSGVFSLTDLPTDLNLSLCQGQEQILVTKASDLPPEVRSYPLTTTEQTPFPSKLQTDLSSSAHLSQDLSTTLAAPSIQSSTKSAQVLGSLTDQEHSSQIKERSVTHQQTVRQIEDCVVAYKESSNRSTRPSHKHQTSPPDKLKESNGFVWWSLLYFLSHITRLLICILLVIGFFFIVFLYDFPASFALYIFSVYCWVYMWKRHQVTRKKAMVG